MAHMEPGPGLHPSAPGTALVLGPCLPDGWEAGRAAPPGTRVGDCRPQVSVRRRWLLPAGPVGSEVAARPAAPRGGDEEPAPDIPGELCGSGGEPWMVPTGTFPLPSFSVSKRMSTYDYLTRDRKQQRSGVTSRQKMGSCRIQIAPEAWASPASRILLSQGRVRPRSPCAQHRAVSAVLLCGTVLCV